MAEYLIQDTTLSRIANAIRDKTGSNDQIAVSDMASRIETIITGGGDTSTMFTATGTTVKLPSFTGNYYVDWGDGTQDTSFTHTYVSSGLHIIRVYDATTIEINSSGTYPNVTSIKTGSTIKSIRGAVFFQNSYLESVIVTENVENVDEYAFSECSKLNSIIYITVEDFRSVFYGFNIELQSLKTVVITGGNVIPNDFLRSYGSSIVKITIPDSVTSIGSYAFDGCTSLTSINIPDSVTSIGNSAFYGCTGLTSIEIPDSVTSIGEYAFYDCTGLTSITIGDGVTSFGYWAFCGCTGLTSIEIPDSVTSIGNFAFYGCTGLTSITIPDSVTSIGGGAFRYCEKLAFINYGGTTSQWTNGTITFGLNWNTGVGNYVVYCTDGTVSKDGAITLN